MGDNSNICTIFEQRRQLAILRKPANRYEGALYNNPYESLTPMYNTDNSNNTIRISEVEYKLQTGDYNNTILLERLNSLTSLSKYIWSYPNIETNSNAIFYSSANAILGLSSGSSAPVFPLVICSTNNIIKIDNISFSIKNGTYANVTELLTQLNSLTSKYGYSWSKDPITNKLIVTKNTVNYKNLIMLTNTNPVSIEIKKIITGLGFQTGKILSAEYIGNLPPVLPITIIASCNWFNIDDILFTVPAAIYNTLSELLSVLNNNHNRFMYNWSSDSDGRLKLTKQNVIHIGNGSTLFGGINPGSFVSPCVLPMPVAYGYTKAQLDMRRKAEVLQYKKSNSQTTGQMTKRGKYAKLFNVAGNNNICPLDLYLPTPSSSSNVPGPVTILQYNESVPLYNYASDADNYADLNPDANAQFQLYAENNILVSNGSKVTVARLLINNPSNAKSIFTVTIPIGIYISADVSGSSIYESVARITSVSIGAYYNGTLVTGTNETFTSFSDKNVKITSASSKSVFSGTLYLGCLTTTITLPTQKGFIYELRMSAESSIVIQFSGTYTNRTFGMFANISNNLQPINCDLVLTSGGPLVPPDNPGKITAMVT